MKGERTDSHETAEQPSTREGRLVILAGPLFGRAFSVDDDATIGRSPEATITLADQPGVSRMHAAIKQLGDTFVIQDLGSRNGTLINGQRITKRSPLRFGDRVQLGADCVMLFTYSDPAEEHLEHLRRMETVGRMTAGIAHDFNNLLMVLVTSLEHLRQLPLDKVLPGEEAGGAAEDGLAAAQQAVQLTQKILSLSRPTDDAMGLVSVDALVRDTAHLCRRLLTSTIRLHISVDSGLMVWGSTAELQQVLMNLCINARDAMPRGGHLRIEARRVGRSSNARGMPGPSDRIRIDVIDNGMGMDEETRRRVFDPFFTTKDHTHGTGLGLATAFATIQRHGGTFHVRSELDQGSTFSIYLPIAAPRPQTEEQHGSPTPMRGVGRAGRRVLVLDDEPLVLRSTQRQLKALGYEGISFDDPEEALNAFRADPNAFDVAIIDLHLDGTTALDILPRLRGIRADLPVLVFSGHWSDLEGVALKQRGATLLQKPCTADTLGRSLRKLVGAEDA
ncbi:MAG: ATP-binding protein [Myxococcota bacterium]